MKSYPSLTKQFLFALAPCAVLLSGAEGIARLDLRMRRGYSYAESLAYVPEQELVFKNNPRAHLWRDHPTRRFGPFFIHPPGPPRLGRVWVLGGSTSAARPDSSDWPAAAGRLNTQLSDMVNMGHDGYGTGQLLIVFRRYAREMAGDELIFFEGWNYRGSASSDVASYRPVNTCSRFDGVAHCVSAKLINASALYGRLFHLRQRQSTGCSQPQPYPETDLYSKDLQMALAEMKSDGRKLSVVLFPGLAMRHDVRELIREAQPCVYEHFAAHRRDYEHRIEVLSAAAKAAGVPVLDARPAYLALPPRHFAALFTDLAHQTAEGNAVLAEALLAARSGRRG